MDCEEENIYKL